MQIKKIVERLENEPVFKEWHEKNKKNYMAHLFKMVDDLNKGIWQIGYCSEHNKITTFILENDDIKIIPEEKAFQKTEKKIRELELKNVFIDLDKALVIAEKFQKEKFSGNFPSKIIIVLQNIAGNIVYNVTYITMSFNTLNIKIDGKDGNVISSELTPMMQFSGKAS